MLTIHPTSSSGHPGVKLTMIDPDLKSTNDLAPGIPDPLTGYCRQRHWASPSEGNGAEGTPLLACDMVTPARFDTGFAGYELHACQYAHPVKKHPLYYMISTLAHDHPLSKHACQTLCILSMCRCWTQCTNGCSQMDMGKWGSPSLSCKKMCLKESQRWTLAPFLSQRLYGTHMLPCLTGTQRTIRFTLFSSSGSPKNLWAPCQFAWALAPGLNPLAFSSPLPSEASLAGGDDLTPGALLAREVAEKTNLLVLRWIQKKNLGCRGFPPSAQDWTPKAQGSLRPSWNERATGAFE